MSAEHDKTLTFVVPAYNMEEYLPRCVDTLVSARKTDDIEVLIVDDGSSDGTLACAQRYEQRYPGVVKAVHQENKGHGGAVNTGVELAQGMYVKVVDADDWVGTDALEQVLDVLRAQNGSDDPLDMVVTDYVYDKVGKKHKHVVDFRNVMPANRRIDWDDLGSFGIAQYLIMHAITFRTQVVRESAMKLPEHTFYVDFIYSYAPFPWVHSMMYLPVPFYHYFIGREGQSVQTDVMIRRVNQLLLVNKCMLAATPERDEVSEGLYRYMIHFLAIEPSITSTFLVLSRNQDNYRVKKQLWRDINSYSPRIGHDVHHQLVSRALNLPGPGGRFAIRVGYRIANGILGFN
ncbi:glycosyltransferase family 2 protein [Bifidobacterium gallicum]|uniref:Glycosyl transferase n=1 Tax=Bifidobacterium gallicum DSM 20093 = LMG 11596 TaxID=561180 RepID=D1NW05_9BIFI|nr:glycosyltransferase family 2 protein [Bifidobacterium gallicum]EFA22291.1 glycosyltransferase, group 2 family protein [Bifidobacterium gallicum DSM 20093 = LMG 11596]KFI60018.1 glycosyl transferase [Bifidobacterium gallicum DSM 20093 = LMG 11596]